MLYLKLSKNLQKNSLFLINNKSRSLLETIKSRSLEIKILLNENLRLDIINKLTNFFKLDSIIDPVTSRLSPGNFIKFNYLCKEYDISLSNVLFDNISLLLNLYQKNKDILFINLIFFIVDYYFTNLSKKNILKHDKIYGIKNYIFNNLNKFLLYNINQNTLLNAINSKLKHE